MEHKQIVAVEKIIHHKGGEVIREPRMNIGHIEDTAKTKQ